MARLTILLVGLIVVSLMFAGQSSAKIDPKSIVGVWLFDKGSGDVASDSSKNGNNGTLVKEPKWVDGKFDKALKFDGVDDYVEISNPDKFNFLTWTYVFWFRTATTAGYPNLVGREFANKHGWTIHLAPNLVFKIRIDTDGGINQLTQVNGNFRDDKWYHGAVALDDKSKTVKLYVNTTFKAEGTYRGNFKTGGGFLRVAAPAVGATIFNGFIDDFAIFNAILTEDDIADIMNKGLSEALSLYAVSPAGKLAATWGKIKSAF